MHRFGKSKKRVIETEAPEATDLNLLLDPHVVSEASEMAENFLCLTVREARSLIGKNNETHSADPFVKITLGSMIKKSRAIYRNRNPMWQQRYVC